MIRLFSIGLVLVSMATNAIGQAPLMVTKLWHPWLVPGTPLGRMDGGAWTVSEQGMIRMGSLSSTHDDMIALYQISLTDFATVPLPLPDAVRYPTELHATSDALYATFHYNSTSAEKREIMRYDFTNKTWTTHDLTTAFTEPFYHLDGSFYLALENVRELGAPRETGVARYDWDKETVTLLASSRRRPGQNQFDDRTPYRIAGIFLGPGNKPCLTTDDGTFYIQEKPGPWPQVFEGSYGDEAITSLGRTIVFNRSGEVTLIDPKKTAPEHLMGSWEPLFRKPGPNGTPAVKEKTPWLEQTLWDAPEKDVFLGVITLWIHDDTLYILVKPKDKGGNYDLLCYQRGKGRTPRHIPLRFHLDDQTRGILSQAHDAFPRQWELSDMEHPDSNLIQVLVPTNQGLCFTTRLAEFWFLPYSDVDAYLKSVQN
jgi:hypothetical protein